MFSKKCVVCERPSGKSKFCGPDCKKVFKKKYNSEYYYKTGAKSKITNTQKVFQALYKVLEVLNIEPDQETEAGKFFSGCLIQARINDEHLGRGNLADEFLGSVGLKYVVHDDEHRIRKVSVDNEF